MKLRAMFQKFMGMTDACREGRGAAYKHRDLLTAWRRISPQYLGFFLAELAYRTENEKTKATFLNVVQAAHNIRWAKDEFEKPEKTDIEIVKRARSNRMYRLAKREFIRVMKRQEQNS
jgi:hypothetical protein